MADIVLSLTHFVVSWIISTIIIYAVVKLFGEKEGIGTAALTALVGSIIYAIAYFALGQGLVASVIGGIAWLLALRGLYKIGWGKSLAIAIVIWVFTSIIAVLLPTLPGPV